jgi:hypothetical protein
MTKTRIIDNTDRPAQPEPFPSESDRQPPRDEEQTRINDPAVAEAAGDERPRREDER